MITVTGWLVALTLQNWKINDGESNRKLPKVFAGNNLRMIKKASRAGLIKKRLTRCVKNKRVWPHWGFLRKISPYCSVSTQHGPFRPCCFWEKKVIDKFQENVRTEGPKFVEFFCQDRRVQKYTEKNKEMDRKGLKSDDGPFRTTSSDGLYQVHLFQTGATDAVEMLTLILSLMYLLLL